MICVRPFKDPIAEIYITLNECLTVAFYIVLGFQFYKEYEISESLAASYCIIIVLVAVMISIISNVISSIVQIKRWFISRKNRGIKPFNATADLKCIETDLKITEGWNK